MDAPLASIPATGNEPEKLSHLHEKRCRAYMRVPSHFRETRQRGLRAVAARARRQRSIIDLM
jgi:hypothetical protein